MTNGEDKRTGLVPVQSTALARVGANTLASRARTDLRFREDAQEWLRKGLELQGSTPADPRHPTSPINPYAKWPSPQGPQAQLEIAAKYIARVLCGSDPIIAARMLGMTPEDQEMAHVAHHLMPDTIAASVQQEEKRIKLTLTERTEMLKEAFQCFEKGHQLDPMNPELLCCLASCYHRGSGVDEDEDEAVCLYRRAADMGDAAAQYCLGVLYDSGQGVSQDSAQAATWLRKAAEQGNTDAQVSLAFAYKEGHGVERNCAQAAIWLRMAAASGDEFAQDELQDSAELYGFSDRDDDSKVPSSPVITRSAEQPSKELSPEQKEAALSEFKRIQDKERLQARPATAKRKED